MVFDPGKTSLIVFAITVHFVTIDFNAKAATRLALKHQRVTKVDTQRMACIRSDIYVEASSGTQPSIGLLSKAPTYPFALRFQLGMPYDLSVVRSGGIPSLTLYEDTVAALNLRFIFIFDLWAD